MKHIITFLSILFLAACANTPAPKSTKFFAGEHYTELNTPKSDQPIVTQYFSFYCGACARIEPSVLSLKAHLKGEAKYQKNPIFYLAGPVEKELAKAHATMVILDQEDQLVTPLFNLVQNRATSPKNEEDIRNFFISQGVDADKFDEIYNSQEVEDTYNVYFQKATPISSIPLLIINNKYQVNYYTFTSLTDEDRYELFDYLLTL